MDFEGYVAGNWARLVRSAVLLGCPLPDAEDLVQTALAKALRSWTRVQAAEQPDSYVYRILVNTLHDQRSRRWRGELPTADLPDAGVEHDHTTGLTVRRALAAMSREHREVLVLRFYADLSERDTAEALGLPAGTVKSRTARALKALATDSSLSEVTP